MVRIVASIFLLEVDGLGVFAKTEQEAAIDLAAALLGFGPFIVNGSAIEVKGCSGMKVHGATTLSPGEAALALAITCALEKVAANEVAGYLGRIGLAAFADAARFVDANRSLVGRIDASPTSIEDDSFTLKEPGNFFSRALSKIRGKNDLGDLEAFEARALMNAQPSSKTSDPARAARLRALRAEWDELAAGTADAE